MVSRDSSKVISGRMVGRRLASMLLPEPGGPMSSTLWLPLAAISRARLASGWPFTSAKSRNSVPSRFPYWASAGESFTFPWRWASSCSTSRMPYTSSPWITAPSAAFSTGTYSRRNPASLALSAMGSTPRMGRSSPERDSSPRKMASSVGHASCWEAFSREMNRGRS